MKVYDPSSDRVTFPPRYDDSFIANALSRIKDGDHFEACTTRLFGVKVEDDAC